MELEAAIRAIRATAAYEHVEVITDSQYVVKGMNEWMIGWKKREWKNVKNVDLWLELDKAAASRNVTWTWTRGHNGDPLNEECDRLNQEAIRNFA
jgi:ribonuclease HI